MLERNWRTFHALVVLTLGFFVHPLRAQVALDTFTAQPLATDGFGIGRTQTLAPAAWNASATIDYANDPLVYRVERGVGLRQKVVADELVLQLGAAVGVHRRVTLFANLPVPLMMRGDSNLVIASMAPEGAGLGDLAVGARIALLVPEGQAFSLAAELIARLPTAELTRPSQRYSGDRVGSYEAALLGELRLGIVDWRVRIGVRLRDPVHVQNLDLGQSVTFATGAQVRLPHDISLHAELIGSTYLDHAFRQHHTPLELLLGPKFRFARGWASVAAGPGLVDGYGSPDFRVVGTVGLGSLVAARSSSAAAARTAERQRIADRPDNAGDRDDGDGCADQNGDGIPDAPDRCAQEPQGTVPEDKKLADADGDEIPDAQDRCPAQAGIAANGGCAPAAAEPEETVQFGRVQFHRGDTVNTPASRPTLLAVLSILKAHPELERVRIEGHADDTGDPDFNGRLSARRASYVARWLTDHGIAAERLELTACGPRHPLQNEASESARAANRRVEFVEVDPAKPAPPDCASVPR